MIHYSKDTAILGKTLSVELAEELFAWLIAKPNRKVDASKCESMHTAVLQVLLLCRPRLTKASPSVWLQQALSSLNK
jgi:hypothetical protein